MKKGLLIAFIISSFTAKASAQEKFSLAQFEKYVGKKVTLCDTVYSYKIFNDTLTMLNMGGNYPNQRFTVVITGKEIVLNFDDIKGKHICVTGDLSKYKGRPEVLIYHPNQIAFK
ncbi:hypothetical protein SAMN05216490_3551 [Mucilaginibacter mallensis]|uniref:Uncharacterized protein n=1 Tax=Mucilaginibacter mallensis TaxID=652787 RepID=A0A1H2AIQ6_MUCMA|nr:hypothetical protein [Mucilaginibacter mallensis]SDT45707.1 hypothetical protein SAMN05216490_3551 [Mucilaginibacter mallensis]